MKILQLLIGSSILTVLITISSCKKNESIPTNTEIVVHGYYRNYSSTIIYSCDSNKHQVDLNGDGIADIVISLSCGDYYHYHCSYGSYTYYFNIAKADTILNPQIAIGDTPQIPLGSIIGASHPFNRNSVQLLAHNFKDYEYPDPRQLPNICDSTMKYIAFEEKSGSDRKYGWFSIHFDSQYNVYLDEVFLSGSLNTTVRAGIH